MAGNVAFVIAAGLLAAASTAVFAVVGAELSLPLLVISFAFGGFLAWVAISRFGSAAEVWRRLRQPPG